MASWSYARSYLVDDLKALHAAGCDVKVIIGDQNEANLISHAKAQLPAARRRIMAKIHDKVLLFSGAYAGGQHKYLWTGSHNYTGNALRNNDEALL